MIWDSDAAVQSQTVHWTEYAKPLPSPPPFEFLNSAAMKTIETNPHLFHVSMPINVDRFQALFSSHPNQPFIASVYRGLCEGFWPFANAHHGEWPITWDNSWRDPKTLEEVFFLQTQIDKEVQAGQYSSSFGLDLLPGMYSMPIHAVPKPGVKKFHFVTDHSAGQFALNNMISWNDIAGVTLDNVQDLGNALQVM